MKLRCCLASGLLLLGMSAVRAQADEPRLFDQAPLQQPITIEPIPLPEPDQETGPELTLADLEDLAVANNPTLGIAWGRIRAARGRQLQSGLPPNPIVGYQGQNIGENGTAGLQSGYLSQEFITGKKLALNRSLLGREVREQQALFTAQERRVLTDVRLQFYEALIAQRRVELTSELVSIADRLVDSSRTLLDAQQLTENDLLQSEIESEEAEILNSNAHNEFAEAWRRLAAVIGVPAIDACRLAGSPEDDLPTYEWEEIYLRTVSQHPQIAAAVARVERARIAITRARRENVPNVSVMAMLGHRNQNDEDIVGVQAGIPIPVINRNQGAIMQAQAELVSAQNEIPRIELDLQNRLAVVYRQYANARQQADRYRQEILPRAQRSLDLVGTGYREGQVDFLTLLTSQRTFIRVNLAYLMSVLDLQQAVALIEGQLLSESLQQQ